MAVGFFSWIRDMKSWRKNISWNWQTVEWRWEKQWLQFQLKWSTTVFSTVNVLNCPTAQLPNCQAAPVALTWVSAMVAGSNICEALDGTTSCERAVTSVWEMPDKLATHQRVVFGRKQWVWAHHQCSSPTRNKCETQIKWQNIAVKQLQTHKRTLHWKQNADAVTSIPVQTPGIAGHCCCLQINAQVVQKVTVTTTDRVLQPIGNPGFVCYCWSRGRAPPLTAFLGKMSPSLAQDLQTPARGKFQQHHHNKDKNWRVTTEFNNLFGMKMLNEHGVDEGFFIRERGIRFTILHLDQGSINTNPKLDPLAPQVVQKIVQMGHTIVWKDRWASQKWT